MTTKQNIPLYTPSLIDAATLESIFVKRQPLLDTIYARHKTSILEPSKQFTLLIGPRGMGKTHLISMLYHKFNTDKQLKDKVMIAWLREEEWGIASYLDLITQIIKTLITQYKIKDLSAPVEHLLSLAFDDAEYESEKILINLLQQQTLLLMAENLNLIFDSIEKQGQEKLRGLIQNTGQITIIAAAQSLFTGVSLRTCPFYGFFNITHLERLSFEDAVELLINIAQYENKQDLVGVLQTEQGRVRVRALHHLAGGSPRIYVIFSQFIQADSLDEFTGPMLKMLDELTPYYQAKMLELSAQQRKIITFLCRARGAVTVQEIARQNHITQQTASGQLKKLKESGFVEAQKSGKESYYEIAEPLMRLVFSVKENRGTPVSIVIELIRHWFSLDELKKFRDNKTLVLLGKNFIDVQMIQQAMEVKEPSPHLSSSMAEFQRYLTLGDCEKAKAILEDLLTFSSDLSNEIMVSLVNYQLSEQAKIRGVNVVKRLGFSQKLISSIPKIYHFSVRYGLLAYCSEKVLLDSDAYEKLVEYPLWEIDDYIELAALFLYLLNKQRISINSINKICITRRISNGLIFGLIYDISTENNDKLGGISQEQFGEMLKLVELFSFVVFAAQNDYVKDLALFNQVEEYFVFPNELILPISSSFLRRNKKHSFNALTDLTLENIENESISQTIKSLKAYSDNGDQKLLMDLPKEVRSLILDKQSEQTND